MNRIPIGLIKALKTIAPPQASGNTNKTDVELLFSVGDVVKCRLNSYTAATKKLELAMTPKKTDENEDDGYVVEGRDAEGEEDTPVVAVEDDQEDYDPEDTLLWWRGAPYKKTADETDVSTLLADEEGIIVQESEKIIEGTWRRLFELDLREDASDFASKIQEAELKELEEEIGELSGLDDELVDSLGFGTTLNTKRFGSFVPIDSLPDAWKKDMSFFRDTEVSNQ